MGLKMRMIIALVNIALFNIGLFSNEDNQKNNS